MSTEVSPEKVDSNTFLKRVSQQFPIRRIYYPGCGEDKTLTETFPKNKIVYLDNDNWDNWVFPMSHEGNLVLGDYGNAPFPDQAFDAVFIQDPDISNGEELSDILRTLRLGGILIHSSFGDCGLYLHTFLSYFNRIPNLTKQNLDFSNSYYTVFKKTSADKALPEVTEDEESKVWSSLKHY